MGMPDLKRLALSVGGRRLGEVTDGPVQGGLEGRLRLFFPGPPLLVDLLCALLVGDRPAQRLVDLVSGVFGEAGPFGERGDLAAAQVEERIRQTG